MYSTIPTVQPMTNNLSVAFTITFNQMTDFGIPWTETKCIKYQVGPYHTTCVKPTRTVIL